jgi:hypothetical protein
VLLCVKNTKETMRMIVMKKIYKKEKKRRILKKLNRGKRKREGNNRDKSMAAVFSCEYNI